MADQFLDKNGVQTLWNKIKQLIENYVPYTGATKDLDLGHQTLSFSTVTSDNDELINYTDVGGMYLLNKFGDTSYANHQIIYNNVNGYGAILYFPGTEEAVGKTSVITIKSDLKPLESDITTLKTDKQDKLTSGTNIKTINNQSILGSGNITINDSRISQLTDKVSTDTTGYQFSSYFIINNMKLEWGHVDSSAGTASVKVSVNFPSSFSGKPIVLLQTYNKTGSPSSEAESTTSQSQYRNAQSVRKVSSTGFMFDTGNSEAHGYSWIAIGRK